MRNPYSASQIGRRFLCPGSAKAEAGLPEVVSPESESGTRIHRYCSIQPDLRQTVELTDDEREVAEEFLRFRDSFGNLEWSLEQGLSLVDDDMNEVTTGTADAVCWDGPNPDDILILDLKTGYQPQPQTVASFQMSVYLAMALMDPLGRCVPKSQARAIIYQPRIKRKYETRLTAAEAPRVVKLVKGVIAACESSHLDIHPSAEACRFCRARHSCPGPRSLAHPLIETETMHDVPAERLAELWEFWKVVKKQGEALDRVFRQAVRENRVPGYYIQERRGNRKFVSTRAAFRTVQDKIPAQEFIQLCTISPSQLEREYVKRTALNGVTKAAASREFVEKTKDVTERGKPKELIQKTEDE